MRPTFDDDIVDSLRYLTIVNGGNENMRTIYDSDFYGGNKNMLCNFKMTNPRQNRGTANFEFECTASEFRRIRRRINDELEPSLIAYAQKVIFNDPATIIIWADGTKTVVKVQNGEKYDPEKGMALCCAKKLLGNKSNFNNEFKKWLPKEPESGLADEIIKKCF